MGYRSLRECVDDLERHNHLVRVGHEVDPNLEIAEIQRRAYECKAPAILFENVSGSPFPALCNLFGTMERARFMFRDTLDSVRKTVELKADPSAAIRNPIRYLTTPFSAWKSLPKSVRRGPVQYAETTLSKLPQIKSWPDDGGPFITLPQVYSEDPQQPGVMQSNLGMYRVQLAGNSYKLNKEIGLHYQIHRGIGVHHARAIDRGEPLRVSVFIGGPPAHTLAAVMPLPEGLSELLFAGMLGGRRFRHVLSDHHRLSADADFCIVGTIDPDRTLPEGPFGDHLGYYSLEHEFPVLRVEKVFHRKDAIWPFTVVGRPPQEDTTFGNLIHELTAPVVPTEIPGLRAMHAVDAAGVHPLLLAIGHERYVPYRPQGPQELLTIANAVLGFGQASLAKYLIIVAHNDVPNLDIHDIKAVFRTMLERIDFERDLHFQTKTTIDTLDYSGSGLNQGSKLVMAAAGPKKRELARELPEAMNALPSAYLNPCIAMPGVVVMQSSADDHLELSRWWTANTPATSNGEEIALVVLVDDSEFASRSLNNFLWVAFTRSNPSHDLFGIEESFEHKHWRCKAPLIIDARIKPHHSPPLIDDPGVTKRVDELAKTGGPLHGII